MPCWLYVEPCIVVSCWFIARHDRHGYMAVDVVLLSLGLIVAGWCFRHSCVRPPILFLGCLICCCNLAEVALVVFIGFFSRMLWEGG